MEKILYYLLFFVVTALQGGMLIGVQYSKTLFAVCGLAFCVLFLAAVFFIFSTMLKR